MATKFPDNPNVGDIHTTENGQRWIWTADGTWDRVIGYASASETEEGVIQLATKAETIAREDELKAVTPFNLGELLAHLNLTDGLPSGGPGYLYKDAGGVVSWQEMAEPSPCGTAAYLGDGPGGANVGFASVVAHTAFSFPTDLSQFNYTLTPTQLIAIQDGDTATPVIEVVTTPTFGMFGGEFANGAQGLPRELRCYPGVNWPVGTLFGGISNQVSLSGDGVTFINVTPGVTAGVGLVVPTSGSDEPIIVTFDWNTIPCPTGVHANGFRYFMLRQNGLGGNQGSLFGAELEIR